jgi:hypothetical protein
MDVLLALGWIGGFIAIVLGFFWAVEALNAHSLQKYDYKPINLGNAVLMVPFWFFLVIAVSTDGLDNILVASALAAAVILVLGWLIAQNTSAAVGAASVALLAVVGLFVLVAIIGIFGALTPKKEER